MKGDLGCVLTWGSGELGSAHCSRFSVGGVSVEVMGERRTDVSLASSLELFCNQPGTSDVSIRVEWTSSLVPMSARQEFDSGTTWRLYDDDSGFQFDFNSPVFGERPYKRLLIDHAFRRAILNMSEEAFENFPLVAEPLEYPLDELLIMHRLTQERAIEVHGCGIVRPDGVGNLFVGHSGAGKSTTTRLWTAQENVEVLSDDRIILREHDGQIFMYGTPWHGEACFASPGRAPVERIFILEHGRGNVLTRLSPGQAVAVLFARGFVPFHRHEYIDSALDFLQQVVSSIPCYRYAFEPGPKAVERIVNFRD